MKLLLCGSFAPSALENYYFEGLKRLNVDVDRFNIHDPYYSSIQKNIFSKVLNKIYPEYYYSPINTNLLNYLKNKTYDVILLFKGLVLFPETIEALKQHCTLVICYNPDHPYKFYSQGSGNKNIEGSICHYDLYITYSREIANSLKNNYGVQSAVIPFGYDDLFSGPSNFIQGVEWAFIGAYDKERESFLSKLFDFQIEIYGDIKWNSRSHNHFIKSHYKGRGLFAQEYLDKMHSAKGVFNLLRKQNLVEESHNMRTFEVPGAGGVLVANRTREQMEFFEENKEAIYFSNIEELKDKLRFYNSNISLLDKIKVAAFKRSVNSGYGYSKRCEQLMKEVNCRI